MLFGCLVDRGLNREALCAPHSTPKKLRGRDCQKSQNLLLRLFTKVSALRTAVAPLPVDTATATTTLDAIFACSGVLTEIHSRENVQDGLMPVLASEVATTFMQPVAPCVAIHWSQHLRGASTRVDEVPARGQWMRALRAPQQNTLGRAMHDGGERLHSQVRLVVKHARHDHVTSALGHLPCTHTLCQSSPLLPTGKPLHTRAQHKSVKVSQGHRQEPRGANLTRVQHGDETEQRLSQT